MTPIPAATTRPRVAHHVLRAGLLLGVVLVTACSGRVAPTPVALGDETWRLPAANWKLDNGETLLCAGGGWPGATIHGSPDNPDVVWVERGASHLRLAWPSAGYIARFTPALEVVDESGHVLFREGDAVGGGCETADPGIRAVSP